MSQDQYDSRLSRAPAALGLVEEVRFDRPDVNVPGPELLYRRRPRVLGKGHQEYIRRNFLETLDPESPVEIGYRLNSGRRGNSDQILARHS